ncbi:MAG: hypothetical protein QXU09_02450 [Thermoproteota archaeon]
MLDVAKGHEVLIYPCFQFRPILHKIRKIHPEVHFSYRSIPVHVPEYGATFSLDLASGNLAAELQTVIRSDKLRKGVIICKVHNFDPRNGRFVSWGNLRYVEIPEEIMNLHIQNLYNELLLFPSTMCGGVIRSPIRRFRLNNPKTCYFTYNTFITYLEEGVRVRKVSGPFHKDMFSVPAFFVRILKNGWVGVEKISLHFCEYPDFVPHSRGYWVSFTETFEIAEKVWNVVDDMYPLATSGDLIPFLTLWFLSAHTDDPVLRVSVPNAVIETIFRRFRKFGLVQNPEFLEVLENLRMRRNPFMVVERGAENTIMECVNPSLVAGLLRLSLYQEGLPGRYSRRILRKPHDLLRRLRSRECEGDFELTLALAPVRELMRIHGRNMERYLKWFASIPEAI